MSAAGRALSKALESPDDWSVRGECAITHVPSGQEFWVGNGPFFFDGHRPGSIAGAIGLIERHWLYFKARKIRAMYVPPPPASAICAERFARATKA